MKSQEMHEYFIERRAIGISFQQIAHELKVSKQTLVNWSKLYEQDIANARAVQKDAILYKLNLTRESRIEMLPSILARMREELLSRSFEDISTEKLIEAILKVSSVLERYNLDTQLQGTETISNADFDVRLKT